MVNGMVVCSVYDDMLAVRFRLLVSAYSCYISSFFTGFISRYYVVAK